MGSDLTFALTIDEDEDSWWTLGYEYGLGDDLSVGAGYKLDFSVDSIDKDETFGLGIKQDITEYFSAQFAVFRIKSEATNGNELDLDIMQIELTKSF
ncbi:MAG: hypothetical protein VW867_08160 [Gammaproteobacteria bacterium]